MFYIVCLLLTFFGWQILHEVAEFPYTSSAKRIQRLITLIEGNKKSVPRKRTKLEFWLTFVPINPCNTFRMYTSLYFHYFHNVWNIQKTFKYQSIEMDILKKKHVAVAPKANPK